MHWLGRALPDKKYDVVYADPPWFYYGSQIKWGAAAKFYNTASDADLLSFPMSELLSERGVLFLWATWPRADFAVDCIRAWGLTYRGGAFVWVKTKKDGKTPIGAQGVRASCVKPTTEPVLWASRVKKGRPMRLSDEGVPHVVMAPRAGHSEKPHEVRRRIERLYPDASKLELFARHSAPGWDSWGDEAPGILVA